MEFEQIIKRLDWLDEEHRKDKIALNALTEQLANTENELKIANQKIKELADELSQFSPAAARLSQYDDTLAQQRTEIVKYINGLEEKHQENLQEIDKRYQIQFEGMQKSISDLRKTKESIAEMQRKLQGCTDEDNRLNKLLMTLDSRMEAIGKATEDVSHAQNVADETRRQDSKRLADLQGEVSAARKRTDEVRGKYELFNDNFRRIETRLNEVIAGEAERRQAQTNFLESQARAQLEQKNTWKDLEAGLESLHKQSETMDRYLQDWDSTQRSLKHAQETYEEIAQKSERRINEITEMQRLAEDRFRQEWVTFKADDQKRWTSYTISQDETHKDARSGVEKLEDRLTALEDLVQTQQDVLQQTKDANEQLFQGMLAQIHELLSAYERIMSTK
jgi:chromosome segregation ATPase